MICASCGTQNMAGCAWDEALAVVDMATFLGPSEPEVKAAADWARQTLTRLGAQPYLDRLETAMTARAPGAQTRATAVTSKTEAAAR